MSSSSTPSTSSSTSVPSKIIISLRVGFVLALANIICVSILAFTWKSAKAAEKSIAVTGSAKKQITSDLIVWTARIQSADADLAAAYAKLRSDVETATSYFVDHQIPAATITPSSITTYKRLARDSRGYETSAVERYELSQSLTITSGDVAKVAAIARSATELIEKDILIESDAPQYLYTKLADLKIEMLASATKDATTRAEKIAVNSRSELGPIQSARMGVLQINAIHNSDTSSTGMNDTSSLDKEITAIVTASFNIR